MKKMTHDSLRGFQQDVMFLISRYLEEPKNSLQKLFRVTNIPYSTLRRYAHGDGENFTLENMLALLDATADIDEQTVFLERYFPQVANYIKKIASDFKGFKKVPDLHEFLKDYDYCLAYFLSTCKTGTTFRQLESYNRPSLIEACSNLIELGFIEKRRNNRLQAKYPNIHFSNKSLINTILRHIISMTELDGYRHGVHFYGVNELTRKKFLEIEVQYNKQVVDLLSDEDNSGDILIGVGHTSVALFQDTDHM